MVTRLKVDWGHGLTELRGKFHGASGEQQRQLPSSLLSRCAYLVDAPNQSEIS